MLCTDRYLFGLTPISIRDFLTHWFPIHPFPQYTQPPKTISKHEGFQEVEKECIGNEWVNKVDQKRMYE